MPKKKNKKKSAVKAKTPYLIQNEDEQQIISWWDETTGSWTNDPLAATLYKTLRAAEKEVTIIHDDGVEYNTMFAIPADPILKKKKEWKENPPIKYLEKKNKPTSRIIPGMALLDYTTGSPRAILVLDVTRLNSVFIVSAAMPAIIEYSPLEYFEEKLKSGKLEILWGPDNKIV